MSFNKTIFILTFCAVLVGVFGVGVQTAKAATVEELQALISQLKVQILQLQVNLAEQRGELSVWCYDFNSNLGFANSGTATVRALHIALEKQGFSVGSDAVSGLYTERTSSAVVGFQQKYSSDTLAPYGLSFGTGYVGKTTRAKLNALYGCGVVQPSVSVPTPTPITTPTPVPTPTLTPTPQPVSSSFALLSPNGGEEMFQGSSYSIIWQPGNSFDRISIILDKSDVTLASDMIVDNIANTGFYTWTIGDVQKGSYKIRVCEYRDPASAYYAVTCDSSDSYFNITKASTLSAPEMVYPVNGQTLNQGSPHAYMFKVKPVVGASGYLFGFFQNGVMVYENWRDNRTLSKNGEFAIWPSNPFYSKIQAGDLQVLVRIWINSQWSEARVINVKLVSPTVLKPSITVLSPNGGEEWVIGNSYTIQWASSNLPTAAQDKISISLIPEESSAGIFILRDTTNDGSENWVVPSTISFGRYKLDVACYIAEAGCTHDSSDNYFSIVSAPTTTSSITVLSPNGGEEWKIGEIHTIRWSAPILSPANVKKAVKLSICFIQTGLGDICKPLTGNFGDMFNASLGQYQWVVSSDIYRPGSDVSNPKIRVADAADENIYDESDNSFSIVSATATTPSITVTSPNGGESWKIGETHDITWSYSGSADKLIQIQLGLPASDGPGIVSNIYASAQRYSWQVSIDVPTRSDYRIIIRETSPTYTFLDSSDNYFSIVSAVEVGSLSLSVASDTPPVSTINLGDIVKGSITVNLLKFNIAAGSEEDVKVSQIIIQLSEMKNGLYSNFSAGNVKNVRLYDGNTLLSTASPFSDVSPSAIFYLSSLVIPKNSTKVLTVVVDIPNTTTISSLVAVVPTELGNYGMTAYGVISEKQLTDSPEQNITLIGSGMGSVMDIVGSGVGLGDVENQLASISDAAENLLAEIKKLLGK